jgi:hypothetical protein
LNVKYFLALAIALLFSGINAGHAQPAAVQQIQNTRLNQQSPLFPSIATGTNAPELYQGENTDVGPQHILQLVPRHLYFNLLLDSQVFYTDNANFAPTREKIGSTVFVNTAQAAFVPKDMTLGDGKFTSSLGVASQWYNYENDSMAGLSFDAQTAFAGAKYALGKWLFALDLSCTRIVSQPHYGLTYQEILPAFTVQRFFPINNSMLVAIGDQVDYHFSDQQNSSYTYTSGTNVISGSTYTEINNRLDNIINLTFTWQLTEHLVLQPAYRFVYSNYRYNTAQNSDRNDYLNSAGVSLAYYFNKNFSMRTFFNYSAKCSDDPNASTYHETDGGLGISVNVLF